MSKRLKIEKTFTQNENTVIHADNEEFAQLVDWTIIKVPQGLGEQHRTGRSILIKKLECKFVINHNITWEPNYDNEADFVNETHLYYILDTQSTSAVEPPTEFDIWENIGSVDAKDLLAFPNSTNEERFKFLRTEKYVFTGNQVYTFTADGTVYNTIQYRVQKEFELKVPELLTFDANVSTPTWNILIYAKSSALDNGKLEGGTFIITNNKVTYSDH